MQEEINEKSNYNACPCGCATRGGKGHSRGMGKLQLAIVGALFTINSYLMAEFFPTYEFAANLSAFIGAVILATPIIFEAIKDLYSGKLYMNELVAIAILAAFMGGSFQEAGIIGFFLLMTIIIESKTASGAQRSIEDLIKLTPDKVNRIIAGNEENINVSELSVGDIIRVRPGENFPVDGKIISGETTANQAPITGESIPVDKEINDEVFAGTQNLTGSVEIEVTKLGQETTLGKVQDMIMEAENIKSPIVRVIDKYASYYTPVILMLAAVTWIVFEDINRVITLFVIACPCAVVLATPTAIVAAVAASARLGILIKDIQNLELASKIKYIVFDKTGTLTKGILSVARLNPFEGHEPAELLLAAASVEQHSNHPTANALCELAKSAELSLNEISNFKEIHGKGVEGTVGNKRYLVGRLAWLNSLGLDIEDANRAEEDPDTHKMSLVYVAINDEIIGWVGFSDKVREETKGLLKELDDSNISYAMVTGDRTPVAMQIAKELGIEEVRSECLPEDKAAFVEDKKLSSIVAVVGDGVNDAPALAAGDLGIAMGAIGSDIAINSASIALMTNDLSRINLLIKLSKKSVFIINQNLIGGLIIVIMGICLSIFGVLTPIVGAILHSLSSVLVIFNSARLVRMGEEHS